MRLLSGQLGNQLTAGSSYVIASAEAERHGVDGDEMAAVINAWATDDRLIYSHTVGKGKTPELTHGGKAMVKQYAKTPLLAEDVP